MTRMYREQAYRKPPIPQPNKLKQVIWVMGAFVMGYVGATLFDVNSLTRAVQTTWQQVTAKKTPISRLVQAPIVLPKPKFEFYTDLAKGEQLDEVVVRKERQAQQVAKADSTPLPVLISQLPSIPQRLVGRTSVPVPVKMVKHVEENTDRYVLQLAAFSRQPDAEKMKKVIEGKGYEVIIVTVQVNHMLWYRVLLGPFNSKSEAESARLAVTQYGRGMIKKVAT